MIDINLQKKLTKNNPIHAAIVFGSSRSEGNTFEAIQIVHQQLGFPLPVVDLAKIKVNEYSYDFNQHDDFHELMSLLLSFDVIILATPVYWYSVSAKMKCFIDRISDLLSIDKDAGRKLRGKKLAVIASYITHPKGIDGFEVPLKNTAQYLGMEYLGTYFHYADEDEVGKNFSKESLGQFINIIRG